MQFLDYQNKELTKERLGSNKRSIWVCPLLFGPN